MTHDNIQALVGTAIVDVEFRQRLLEDAGSVIGEFDLTPDEVSAILAIKASTFQGFATQIHTWVASTSSITVLYM